MKTSITVSEKTFKTFLVVGSIFIVILVAYALINGQVSNLKWS